MEKFMDYFREVAYLSFFNPTNLNISSNGNTFVKIIKKQNIDKLAPIASIVCKFWLKLKI